MDVEYPTLIETMGAIITCSGTYFPLYYPKRVSSLENVLHTDDSPLYVPTKIGLPLWLHQLSSLSSDPDNEQENIQVRYLATCSSTASLINANDQDSAALCADMLTGSRLVMQKDEFNLIPQHLEVLCAFCGRIIELTF
ncbi:hypothetical protein N7G274_006926 [Stereocaulon virgatum]|uniref:Uncharacterized protein n=1 Tax=Stereocaulon virgatum TaxID=373712 RepID=A0ABR4A479_9LECA